MAGKKLANKVAVVTGASKGNWGGHCQTVGRGRGRRVVNSRDAVQQKRCGTGGSPKSPAGRAGDGGAGQRGQPGRYSAPVRRGQESVRAVGRAGQQRGHLRVRAAGRDHARCTSTNSFDLNVLGLLLTTQEAGKHFGPEGGSIVNTSSVVSTLAIADARSTAPPRRRWTPSAR